RGAVPPRGRAADRSVRPREARTQALRRPETPPSRSVGSPWRRRAYATFGVGGVGAPVPPAKLHRARAPGPTTSVEFPIRSA
ncbi:hypothetical protein NGM37_10355, partial [Streptomyces sp. TRM76130]|nr:hypothetical protein [Streptomyces sp. TRM76130]